MQQHTVKSVGCSESIYAHTPSAVFDTNIHIKPIISAFFLPILLIVIACIGEHTTPAKLKQHKVIAIRTVSI